MSTTLSVQHGKKIIKVEADKAYLFFNHCQKDGLKIVLPQDARERDKCLRGQLPKALAHFLQIDDSDGQRQIYRLLNEVDMGTDELLDDEGIPHVDSWLLKTGREAVLSDSDESDTSVSGESTNSEHSESSDQHEQTVIEFQPRLTEDDAIDLEVSTPSARHRPYRTNIRPPEDFESRVEAPDYWRLLEHAQRQAVKVIFRDRVKHPEHVSSDAYAKFLEDLWIRKGRVVKFRSYPELFGNDEHDAFRIGAAGELFVSLRALVYITCRY